MRPRFTLGTLILAAGAALAVQSCASRDLAIRGDVSADVYALVSVDGKTVPARVYHDGVGLQVLSGAFVLRADGTCVSKTVFVPPNGRKVTREVTASFTREGPRLTMHWQGAGTTVGTIEGDTFTMNNKGMLFVYKK